MIIKRRSTQKNLDNYPLIQQGSHPLCWAAAIASILAFEEPARYGYITAWQVMEKAGNGYDGTYDWQARNYLENLLSNVYKPRLVGVLTPHEIMTVINNVDPAYISAGSVSNGAHTVALCGYNSWNTGFTFRTMNSGTYQFETSYYGARPGFAYNNVTFYWYSTVRLYY